MKHPTNPNLSPGEKAEMWLDLNDFIRLLIISSLDGPQLEKRLQRMREEHLQGHQKFLARLGELRR